MNRSILSSLALASVASMGAAQGGWIAGGNTQVSHVDPTGSGTVTNYAWGASAGTSRGHLMGWDGNLYRSDWTGNGLVRNDLPSTTLVTVVSNDTTNAIAGAPYQPAFDLDAMGGPGVFCVDGNGAPSPAPSAQRNWFYLDRLDQAAPRTAVMSGWFTNVDVPMADCFNHPFRPGEFITVGFATSDNKVMSWTIPSTVGAMTPTPIVTLSNICHYDALIHEDQKLYCWHSTATQTGFQVVDLVAGTQSFLAVTGIPFMGAGYAGVWNDPFEKPGRKAYVLQEAGAADLLYEVDLLTGTATASTATIPAGAYNTARSEEDAQLSSWRMPAPAPGLRTRRFHVNFGTVSVGDGYFLFPTIAGYSSTALTVDGNEIWLTPDFATILAASNALGANTVGIFTTTSGEIDIDVTLPILGAKAVWAVARVSNGKVVDVSNYIMVGL